jgi:hypothetical protein
MNKKEKQILEVIKNNLLEGEEYRAKQFIFENDKFIFSDKRSEQFDFEFGKLEQEIDWTPSRYESDYEYNQQMDRVSNDPWGY